MRIQITDSDDLFLRLEDGDIEAFEEIIQSIDETNSHIEYGMVEALEADLGLIKDYLPENGK